MANKHLATYLHDHLAGSVVAIDLLEHLEKAHAQEGPLLAALRKDILADQDELKALIERVGGSTGTVRAAVGWLGEKAARLKLSMDDAGDGSFRLLEATELVAVGIEGKRGLWVALAEVASVVPELRGPDYTLLTERAVEQRQRIERVRLSAARSALA